VITVDWSTRTAYRERLIDWVQLDRWQAPFAVMLTMRQCVTVPNGTTSVTQWLTDTAATQNMRHFLNKLDRSVFGKAAVRFGKRIGCMPVLEGGAGKRLHYHAVGRLTERLPTLDQTAFIASANGSIDLLSAIGAPCPFVVSLTQSA
jgi:hypothetical protein